MSKQHFIGRKKELAYLNNLLQKKTANLVVIKGKRRVGKSRLIQEFSKGKNFLSFMGIPPDSNTTAQDQKNEFMRQLGNQLGYGDSLKLDDWGSIFSFLARQSSQGSIIILLDEISWMGSKDHTFLGKLKTIWDTEFKNNPDLMLILCGSVSNWIEENILASTGFYGRISWTLTLQELSLAESYEFVRKKGFIGSNQDFFSLLSVTGGIPWYLEQIQQNDSVNSFLLKQCFSKGGVLVDEFDRIFNDLFKQRNLIYQRIVELLVSSPSTFEGIRKALNYQKGGRLSEYISHLIEAGFISRHFAWSFKTRKTSRISQYRLSDNYVRFYVKYILPNFERISEGYFTESFSISSLSGWSNIMGLQFESLVLKNRLEIIRALNINPMDIVADNPYLQTATKAKAGCQIDYLIQTQTNSLYLIEIKTTKNSIGIAVIEEIKQKIKALIIPKGLAIIPVLVHIGSVDDSVVDSGFFHSIINFEQFLK